MCKDGSNPANMITNIIKRMFSSFDSNVAYNIGSSLTFFKFSSIIFQYCVPNNVGYVRLNRH